MMHTYTFPCALPRFEADALNRESGCVYNHAKQERASDWWWGCVGSCAIETPTVRSIR